MVQAGLYGPSNEATVGLTIDVSNEFQIVDNTESVVYYRRLTSSTFDSGTVVPHALRRVATKQELQLASSLANQGLIWNLWTSEVGGLPSNYFQDPNAVWDGSTVFTTSIPVYGIQVGQIANIVGLYAARIVSIASHTITLSPTAFIGSAPSAGSYSMFVNAANPEVDDKIGSAPFRVNSFSILTPGVNYVVNDRIILAAGSASSPAIMNVDSIDLAGGILSASLVSGGSFTALPTNPTPVEGGGGMEATFVVTWLPIDQNNFWSCLRCEDTTWRTRWRITTVQELH